MLLALRGGPAGCPRRKGRCPMPTKAAGADGEQSAKKSGVLTNPIRNQTIFAVVCLALGVAFLALPDFLRYYCGYVIGSLLCVIGLTYIVIYFVRRPVSGVYRTEFATGTLVVAAGVYVIVASFRPDAAGISSITLRMIVTALGVLVAADGALKLQYTLDLARMRFSAWWVGLPLSLLGLALGVLMALGLVDAAGVYLRLLDGGFLGAMLMLGVALCGNGALDLGMVVLVAVRNHLAGKAEAAAAAAPAAAPPSQEPYAGYYPPSQDTPPAPPQY